MTAEARFVHLSGGREGAVDLVGSEGALIGRDAAQCAVSVDPSKDDSVSRVHARVWFDGRSWWVEDLNSSNGLIVQGIKISQPTPLNGGEILKLSTRLSLRFEIVPARRAPAPSSPPKSHEVDDPFSPAAGSNWTPSSSPAKDPEATDAALQGSRRDDETGMLPAAQRRAEPRSQRGQSKEVALYRGLVVGLLVVVLVLAAGWARREYGFRQHKQAQVELVANTQEVWNEISTVSADDMDATGSLTDEAVDRHLQALLALMDASDREAQLATKQGQNVFIEEEPLKAHIQKMLAELSGTPVNLPVPDAFRDKVAKSVLRYVKDRLGYCRHTALKAELQERLRAELPAESVGGKVVLDSLVYIPWVESRYSPTVCSHAGARGMWQFIPPTGREYNLTVNDIVDERCNWRKATPSAAQYFQTLLKQLDGYPFLAIASYNAGTTRPKRIANSKKIDKRLRNFYGFMAADLLHPETQNYVPRFIGASFVGENPDEAFKVARSLNPRVKQPGQCKPEELEIPPARNCANPTTCRGRWK